MNWLHEALAKYPELAVYLALGIGFWVGNLKIRGFSLGGTTGSLLAGLAIGLAFEVPVSGPATSRWSSCCSCSGSATRSGRSSSAR